MNKRNLSILIAAATASVLVCCSKQNETDPKIPESGDGQFQSLELTSVRESEFQSKAVVDGETFPQDGHIGLFLFADAAASQTYGEGYENVDYSYNSTKEKWTASPSIKVGSTPGYLYGYYPYKAGNQQQPVNIKAIPVVSSFNGDDVMYATPQDPITDQTAGNVSVTMKHALARVCITVVSKGYTGNAKLSKIKFSGAEIAPEGTLNALDGSVTATKSDVTLDVTGDAQTITTAGTIYECLLVPSKAVESKQDVNLTLTIDGEDKTASLSDGNGVIIAQGTKSNITIGLSNSGISVQTVSVEDWNIVEVGGHTVTVKRSSEDGIADDVFLDVTSNGSTVTIKSLTALTGRWANCTCTPAGKATCSPSIDAETGICTFTISDVQEDITAEVGYLKCNAAAVYDSDLGTVNLNGDGVASGTSVQFFGGEEVKFLAEAKSGYGFVKWTDGGGVELSADNSYTIPRISSDITLNAIFGYEITAKTKPVGAGTIKGAGTYPKGSTATLTATPGGIGAKFIGWAKADSPGNIITEENSYTISSVDQSASYIAVFRLTEALPGLFTVNASGKKVVFSKGNLWCNHAYAPFQESDFLFESHQYEYNELTTNDGKRLDSHISHFMWCGSASQAVSLRYDDSWNGANTFFTDKTDFAVDGVSAWRTLTTAEWHYLFGTNTDRNGRYKTGVTVCGAENCVVLVPDDWDWSTALGSGWKNEYSDVTTPTWQEMEYAGAVCLPASGWRKSDSYDVQTLGTSGYYWSGSPIGTDRAFDLFFGSGYVNPDYNDLRSRAYSVRLVADY